MVQLTRIYTRGGDGGQTSLGDGARVAKHDPRVEAYGAVDETNAAVGVARLHASAVADTLLARIQNDLFDVGADLCAPPAPDEADGGRVRLRVTPEQAARLEREIDALNAELAPLTSFVLPGGCPSAAHLHVARACARRAERETCRLAEIEPVGAAVIQYLNRLSDHLFVLSRWENHHGPGDVLWIPGAHRDASEP